MTKNILKLILAFSSSWFLSGAIFAETTSNVDCSEVGIDAIPGTPTHVGNEVSSSVSFHNTTYNMVTFALDTNSYVTDTNTGEAFLSSNAGPTVVIPPNGQQIVNFMVTIGNPAIMGPQHALNAFNKVCKKLGF